MLFRKPPLPGPPLSLPEKLFETLRGAEGAAKYFLEPPGEIFVGDAKEIFMDLFRGSV